jgi:hypothetical protein
MNDIQSSQSRSRTTDGVGLNGGGFRLMLKKSSLLELSASLRHICVRLDFGAE